MLTLLCMFVFSADAYSQELAEIFADKQPKMFPKEIMDQGLVNRFNFENYVGFIKSIPFSEMVEVKKSMERFNLYGHVEEFFSNHGLSVEQGLDFAVSSLLKYWQSTDNDLTLDPQSISEPVGTLKRVQKLLEIFCRAIGECYFEPKAIDSELEAFSGCSLEVKDVFFMFALKVRDHYPAVISKESQRYLEEYLKEYLDEGECPELWTTGDRKVLIPAVA